MTDDYPGEHPYTFTGGTIKHVAVDVSGDPHVDLEREAQAMLARGVGTQEGRRLGGVAGPSRRPSCC